MALYINTLVGVLTVAVDHGIRKGFSLLKAREGWKEKQPAVVTVNGTKGTALTQLRSGEVSTQLSPWHGHIAHRALSDF